MKVKPKSENVTVTGIVARITLHRKLK